MADLKVLTPEILDLVKTKVDDVLDFNKWGDQIKNVILSYGVKSIEMFDGMIIKYLLEWFDGKVLAPIVQQPELQETVNEFVKALAEERWMDAVDFIDDLLVGTIKTPWFTNPLAEQKLYTGLCYQIQAVFIQLDFQKKITNGS